MSRITRVALAAAMLIGWAAPATAASITAAAIEAYYEAWSHRDVDAVLSYFTEDCVYEDVATGDLATGKTEVRAFAEDFLEGSPDVRVEPATITIGDQRAAVEWVMSGGSGADAWRVRGAAVMVVRDGKISRATDYWNAGE